MTPLEKILDDPDSTLIGWACDSTQLVTRPTPAWKRPRVRPWTRCNAYISNLARSRVDVGSEVLWEISVDSDVFRVFL